MRKNVGLCVAVLLSWAIVASTAVAVPPPILPVQGYLTDDKDVALDGTYKLGFTLFDDMTAGTSLFTTTQPVTVGAGHFTAYLGDQATLDLKTLRDHAIVWLEITVVQACGTDTACSTGTLLNRKLAPRLQIGTTAFAADAAYCGDATTVGGQASSAFAAAGHTHAYSSLTGIPASFPPSAHQHPWSDITGAPVFATANQPCSGTDKVTGIDASGHVTCGADANSGGTVTGIHPDATASGLTGSCASGDCTALAVSFAGTGSANTAVRSDHNHDATYLPLAGGTLTRVACTTPAAGAVDCCCPTGAAISGGAYFTAATDFMAASWPRSAGGKNCWQVECRSASGATKACYGIYAICAPNLQPWQ